MISASRTLGSRAERAELRQRGVDVEAGDGAPSDVAQGRHGGRPRGMTVAVLGIDGAGKSSLIHELRWTCPMPTRSIYMGLWKKGGLLDHAALRPIRITARPLIAWRRYLTGRWHRARGRLVLFDRYTYDPYEAPEPPLALVKSAYMRFLAVTCPPPDLVLLLDVPADVAVARKHEEEPTDLAKKRKLFLDLRTRLPNVRVVDATRPLDDVVADSYEHIRRALVARDLGRVSDSAEHGVGQVVAGRRRSVHGARARIARRARGRRVLSQVQSSLPSILADPAIESAGIDLSTQSVRSTESGVVVASLGTTHGTMFAVKIAATSGAARSLKSETDVLTSLAQDLRLAHLRKLIPTVISVGEAGPYQYVVESGLPGVPGDTMIHDEARCDRMLTTARSIADDFHTATASDTVVTGEMIHEWIELPSASIARALERRDRDVGRALSRVRNAAETALKGRVVRTSWIHGDFWPGNILLAEDASQVTGIVDWDRARSEHLPAVDDRHLALYTRALSEGNDLGFILRRELAATPDGAGTDEGLSRSLLLVYWLHHVAGNLERSDAYARNRRWLRLNVYAVLNQ